MHDWMNDQFETRIGEVAGAFSYPPTPNVTGRVAVTLHWKVRRWQPELTPLWVGVLTFIVLVIGGLMAVPSVRAAVIEFIQIGVIRIFTEEDIPPLPATQESQEPFLLVTPEPSPGFLPIIPTSTATIAPPLNSVLELEGEVSLDEAIEQVDFPILLPAYPPELGSPDKVFFQQLNGGNGVFLVWFEDENPDQVRISLLLLSPGAFVGKGAPAQVQETAVNGIRAIWTQGDHRLILQTGPNQTDLVQFFIDGNVLIWEIDGITYRLETYLDLEETLKIAESIR